MLNCREWVLLLTNFTEASTGSEAYDWQSLIYERNVSIKSEDEIDPASHLSRWGYLETRRKITVDHMAAVAPDVFRRKPSGGTLLPILKE